MQHLSELLSISGFRRGKRNRSLSFIIIHIDAVFIAETFKSVYMIERTYVFLVAAAISMLFLSLALMVPHYLDTDHVVRVVFC